MNSARRAGPAVRFRGKLQHSRPLHRRGITNPSLDGSSGRRNEKVRPTEVVSDLRVAPPGLKPGLS